MGNTDEMTSEEAERVEYERLRAKYANEPESSQDGSQSDAEASGAFSHYLVLADGTTVKHLQPDENPYEAFPTTHNGVAVIQVRNAFGPGPDDMTRKAERARR